MEKNVIRSIFKSKKEVAEGVKAFTLEPEEKISYEAGQFAFFDFLADGKEYSKHFTISNSPVKKEIEFTTMIRESEYKKALDSLYEGHEVFIKRINGNFTLEEVKSLVFLAGGIGITPVKSMLEYVTDMSKEIQAKLFYSNRNVKTISFRRWLDEIKEKLKTLDIVHTLTDLATEEEKNAWDQETGYIDESMLSRHIDNTQECIFYISGPPSFNSSMKKMLLEEAQIKKENIKTEVFYGY